MAVLATAIKGNLTVNDLPELELGYAPPYSSSKDPINILGYKAIDMLKSKSRLKAGIYFLNIIFKLVNKFEARFIQ